MSDYYIGLMSGTSLDGTDGVLVNFCDDRLKVLVSASRPFEPALKAELLALNTSGEDELHRAARAANQLAASYASVVQELLERSASAGISAGQIKAIGAHGQTVRHQPQRVAAGPSGAGYTIQINNPALLAELTGVDVVADFRSRDVAAGGQGAPLVPAFHQSIFGQPGQTICVLNLGGIANLSVLPGNKGRPVLGFDCGPANALMDAWCQQHTGRPFDSGGAWAASGRLIPELLASLLDLPFFAQRPPKSTGRDLFSLQWLALKLAPFSGAEACDVQNTLTELTANVCAADTLRYAKHSKLLIVCGGGAFNRHLMQRLQARLPGMQVSTSEAYGLPPVEVEAAAFAWLARQTMLRRAGNLESVTGAAGPRVLGAIYPK